MCLLKKGNPRRLRRGGCQASVLMQQTLALGQGFGMPAIDLGMPSPHEGSFCCEKRLQAAGHSMDPFSVCYVR